ncbi:hypothetical protein MMC29_001199 [Sticta canariensis]|nr:hypothetical protein [Sticta canariensis]
MPKGTKKGKEPMVEVKFLSVDWTSDLFALTYRLLSVLEEFDGLRRTIWAGERDKPTARKKADAHRDIAEKIFHSLPQYAELIATDSGKKHYGATMKACITKLQEQYASVKERLGVTEAGLPNKESIWTGSELMNVWEAVKKTCLYWFQLRDLIGSCTSLCDHAITNSQRDMNSSVFMTRGRPLKMDEVFGGDEETPLPYTDSATRLDIEPSVRFLLVCFENYN